MPHHRISRPQLAAILEAFSDRLEELRRLLLADDDQPWRPRVHFGIPSFYSTKTGKFIPMTIKVPDDALALVPLVFTDVAGHNLTGSTTGVSATVSDPTLALAEVTVDGNWVQLTPLQLSGHGTVTYTDTGDGISTTFDFDIVTPSPASVTANEAGLVLKPNPNPPAGAPGSTITGAAGGGGAAPGP